MPLGEFNKSVSRFKTKYEVIFSAQDIASANYQSIEDLEEASEKLAELGEVLGEQRNDEDFLDARDKAAQHLEEQEEDLLKRSYLNEKIEKGENLSAEEIAFKEELAALEDREKKYQEFIEKYGLDAEIRNTGQAVSAATFYIDQLSDTLSGKISVEDMSHAASYMDKGFDQTLSDLSVIVTGDKSTEYIEAWARTQFGDKIYDAASAIKKGASTAISGVDDFMNLGDTFGGSWRDPLAAAKKIENGLKTIQSAVTKVSTVANDIFSAVTGKDSVVLGKLDNLNSMGIGTAGAFAGAAGIGIGSINSFGQGNIGAGIGGIKDSITSARKAYSDLIGKDIENKKIELSKEELTLSENHNTDSRDDNSSTNLIADASSGSTACSDADDDFGADMISEINVVLDGCASSQNSFCIINGEKYKLNSYSLSQELLQPMMLTFCIEKEDKTETQSDVVFADTAHIIGKSLEINVSAIKINQEGSDVRPQKAFVFKGMIIDVSASRAAASTQTANITAATWDALLQTAPHCRSFEDMTLKDIIDSVLKPYGDIKSRISPRFKDKIPYIVQYNQSDYEFISMLSARFGEWMYNTGETFVFGEMDDSDTSSVKLEYPGGSLMSYDLHQSMTSFSFSHLLPNYYQYGKENAILKESARGMADGTLNNWTDKAYNASVQRFDSEKVAALNAGGFDDGKGDEGSASILDYSLKIESKGKKTGIMTVHGSSKLAILKIGQTFLIRDNVQNKSGESKDVEQKALKVIGISHSFDYRQEYSNNFTAIPVACDYPSYSDADIFPPAPPQRAKVVDNKDEQELGRIRVQFPWQEIQGKDVKTPWLRIAVPYAGEGKGQLFVPEIGEEVMVGFEMNNAERPYIIGAFYNGGDGKPDENWAVSKEESGTGNNIKAIRTRNGHTILFNDRGDAGLIEIYDNKNNTYHITLSADDKKISIYSAGEIEVIAEGDIGMKSNGSISMDAKKEVSIQASKVNVR